MYEVYTNSDSFIAHLQHEEAKVLLGKLASKLKISASVWCDGELSVCFLLFIYYYYNYYFNDFEDYLFNYLFELFYYYC